MKKLLIGLWIFVLASSFGVVSFGVWSIITRTVISKKSTINLEQSPLKPVIDFARNSNNASSYVTWKSVCAPAPIHSVSMSLSKYNEVRGKSIMTKMYFYDYDPNNGFKVTVWDFGDTTGNALMAMEDLDLDGRIDSGSTTVSVGPDDRGHQYIRTIEIPLDFLQHQFDEAIGMLPR
mgnify:CR=1 FL=1